jgi:hypothetical protein
MAALDLSEHPQIRVVSVTNGWVLMADDGEELATVEVYDCSESPCEAFAELLRALIERIGPRDPFSINVRKQEIEVSVVDV